MGAAGSDIPPTSTTSLPASRLAREPRGQRRLDVRRRFRFRLSGRGADLSFEFLFVGQTCELVRDHQGVLRRDLESLPAGLARDLIVETEQIVACFCELGPVLLARSSRQPVFLRSPDPPNAVFGSPATPDALIPSGSDFRFLREQVAFVKGHAAMVATNGDPGVRGRRIRDHDMEQVGVYVLAALLLPLLRRAPYRVELDVPLRRAWMTAARRLGQRRLSSRWTQCGGRPRQRTERRRVRQRCRPATVPVDEQLQAVLQGSKRQVGLEVGRDLPRRRTAGKAADCRLDDAEFPFSYASRHPWSEHPFARRRRAARRAVSGSSARRPAHMSGIESPPTPRRVRRTRRRARRSGLAARTATRGPRTRAAPRWR